MNQIVPVAGGAVVPAFTMSDMKMVAEAIAKGGLFGSTDPYAVLTLCMLAQAEGQHPAVVFRDYHIIKGKPAKKADAMLRDFVTAGGKVEWHALDDAKADATFSHPGGGSVRIDWTMERAKQAQLTTDMWRKYPRQMLRSRVISEGVRTVYPGATSGLYEVGEVQDITADQAPVQDALPAPVEAAAEQDGRQSRRSAPLQGPIKTRAAIRTACGTFVRDLHGCSDADMLDVVLSDSKALIDQVEAECQYFWEGDGADFLGLKKEIEAARERVAIESAEGWQPNTLDAG